jgi:hypothetical protein
MKFLDFGMLNGSSNACARIRNRGQAPEWSVATKLELDGFDIVVVGIVGGASHCDE